MALRRLNLTLCVCLVGGQFLSCNSSWTEGNTLWMNQWWACKGAEEKHSWAEEEKQQSLFMKQVIDFRAVFHTLQTICVKMCLWHVAMNNLVATEQEVAVLHALPSILSARAFIWASCNGPAEAERAEKIVSALLHLSVVPPPPCWVVSEQTSLQSKTATFYKVEKLPYLCPWLCNTRWGTQNTCNTTHRFSDVLAPSLSAQDGSGRRKNN